MFIGGEGIIKQSAMPLSCYVYRAVWRNVIVLLHNVVVLAIVFHAALPIRHLLEYLRDCARAGSAHRQPADRHARAGIISTRFRDLPPTMTNIMQVLFYITPILYEPSQLPPKRRLIAHYNPFYHVIEVFRRPLIGETAAMGKLRRGHPHARARRPRRLRLFRRFRGRIAYWL